MSACLHVCLPACVPAWFPDGQWHHAAPPYCEPRPLPVPPHPSLPRPAGPTAPLLPWVAYPLPSPCSPSEEEEAAAFDHADGLWGVEEQKDEGVKGVPVGRSPRHVQVHGGSSL